MKRYTTLLCLIAFICGVRLVAGSVRYTELHPWQDCNVSFDFLWPAHASHRFWSGHSKEQMVDLDGDGNPEFRFHFVTFSSVIQPLQEGAEVYALMASDAWNFQRNEIIGPQTDIDGDLIEWHHRPPRVTSSGFRINGTVEIPLEGENRVSVSGRFIGPADDFVGVRFKLNGELHYGWILVDAPQDYWDSFAVYAWAYETEPNVAIAAGAVPAVSNPFEITCQRYEIGATSMVAHFAWTGADIGKKYIVEFSEDLVIWEVATEGEIEALRPVVVARTKVFPLPQRSSTFFRVRSLAD